MNKLENSDEIKDKIKDVFDDDKIQIPESIRPENLDFMLDDAMERRKQNHTPHRKPIWKAASIAAAVLLIAIPIGIHNYRAGQNKATGEIKKTVTYEQIYQEINRAEAYTYSETDSENAVASEDKETSGAASSYSKTDTQVEGVDEADIVKTDGNYLYYVTGDRQVSIFRADGKQGATHVCDLTAKQSIEDLYISNGTLILLSSEQSDTYDVNDWYKATTYLEFYDVLDPKNPKQIAQLQQDGTIDTSRIYDGYLYLFTTCETPNNFDKNDLNSYIPKVGETCVKAKDFIVEQCERVNQYTIISSIDLKHPTKFTDRKVFLSSDTKEYVNENNIYLLSYEGNENDTTICKFQYDKGRIAFKKTVKVDGQINNNYSLDEYKGYLRVLTTVNKHGNEDYNNVYVFDSKLNKTDSITKIAKGEIIYSARFLKDRGYFVTYRNTDPLFCVNLKNPRNIKIDSKLKIPGFSSFLHEYSKNRLLGVGMDTGMDGSEQLGVKLSMFDISNPNVMKEIAKYTKQTSTNDELQDNNKALLIMREKNLIGFGCLKGRLTSRYSYQVVKYDEKSGFTEYIDILADTTANRSRAIYIGDVLYVLFLNDDGTSDIKSVDLVKREKIGETIHISDHTTIQ
ncbi:hypothetical protein lbkm_1274 [Lachnospiraceae bacterium KM106-2]|nr:hypothetical protein lbkm_1274 [Lachnospiraceae bacterium KM106-2]